MKNLEEADRVTQRLNGATLYGSRLVVKIARDNDGQGWKRNTTCRSQSTEYKKTGIGLDDEAIVQKVRTMISTEEDIGKENFKRIIGHVENEDLWNLRRCLVGVMDMVCSVSSIHSMLLKWGLGDINVQRLGAKMYLLTITDEELSQMLEDVNWSYLKEIFSDVIPWSEKTSYSVRATWLEIRGLPLHCWNSVSLKKVADLWGVFEALGKNDKHSLDCEKATVLISTNQWKKEEKSCDESVSESTSDLKLDSRQKRHEVVEVDRSCSGTEVEVINVMCAEKDRINCLNREKEDCGDIIMEAELMGGVSKDENLTAFLVNGDEESNKKVCSLGHDENMAVGNSLGIQKVISVEKVGQENTRVDGSGIGPIGVSSIQSGHEGKFGVGFKVKAQEFKSSWANMLDETLNYGKGFNLNVRGKALSDGENEKDFFNDLEARKGKKRGKGTKKFGSLLELQNKSITASERRKRDKALRSRKWNKQFLKKT
ncbi:hypothetical protein V6N13_050566 [Hibiscus sabdariffa]